MKADDIHGRASAPKVLRSFAAGIALCALLLLPMGGMAGQPRFATIPLDDLVIVIPIDSDGDGLKDADERRIYGTDPKRADTDGDGMDDGWEVAHGLNPLVNDANLDTDGDGFSNLVEHKAGTDPQSAGSTPKVIVRYEYNSSGALVSAAASVVP